MNAAAVIGGLAVGTAVGALMSSQTVCMNAGFRRAVFERRPEILRIFAVAIAAQLLLIPALIALDVELFSSASALPAIGLFPVAQVVGGLLFGAGMALAGGCITGILWKSGAGSTATAIAIGGFIAGELLIRGPFESLAVDLDDASSGAEEQTLYGLLGIDYVPIALALGVLILVLLRRSSRAVVRTGLLLGALGAIAWVVAGWADYTYGLGFVGVPSNIGDSLDAGDMGLLSFATFLALGVIAGAAATVRGPIRLPDASRSLCAAGGGLAMGIGGTLAHGCNIGNGLTGIPLLSLGSLLAITMMAAGALLTWKFVLASRPALRGTERPEPDW